MNDCGTVLHVNHLLECTAPRHETDKSDKSCIARLQQATHNQWFRFLRPLLWELHLLSIPFMQHRGATHCPNRLVSKLSKCFHLVITCNNCMILHGCLCHPLSTWSLQVKFGTPSTFKEIVRRVWRLACLAWTDLKHFQTQNACNICRQPHQDEGDHRYWYYLHASSHQSNHKLGWRRQRRSGKKNIINRRLQGRRLNRSCLWTKQAQWSRNQSKDQEGPKHKTYQKRRVVTVLQGSDANI